MDSMYNINKYPKKSIITMSLAGMTATPKLLHEVDADQRKFERSDGYEAKMMRKCEECFAVAWRSRSSI
jgi:hypothetical protein